MIELLETILGLVALLIVYIAWSWFSSEPPILPKLDTEQWWGPNELREKQDTSIKPFEIKFTDDMITDLRSRLKNHRPLVPPLEGVAFEYGFNSNAIEPWLKYWAEEYPFKEREQFLNQFPQYKTNIQGLDIHFIRVKPQVPAGVEILPLLILHGWPGSVREFYEAIPLLTKQQPGYNFAFEVIAPSQPGFGFSQGAVRPGLAPPQVSVIFRNLMHRLGFKKFYLQGGDWGSVVASALVTLFPEDILGHHTNMPVAHNKKAAFKTILGAYIPSLVVESRLAHRMYPLSDFFAFVLEEFGYYHLQATRPDSVGVALSDSPSGLLAYILEKFSVWTCRDYRFKADGGLELGYSKAQLIDNLMIYWTSNSITTSIRLYAEEVSRKNQQLGLGEFPTPVPTWALQAKHETMYQPSGILKTKFPNLLGITLTDDGGHFFALELPQVFANDVFKAVNEFRNWHKKTAKTEL